ncbi:NPCBM/NEW2 domain-containing protein [Cyanobium sp. ULC084]
MSVKVASSEVSFSSFTEHVYPGLTTSFSGQAYAILGAVEPPKLASIAFIDSRVNEPQVLLSELQADLKFILDPHKDGMHQISEIVSRYQGLARVDIITHGGMGELLLGGGSINAGNLAAHSPLFSEWKSHLADDADILIYGCNVASGDAGKAFINELSSLTGADVAASTNLTGSSSKGGDWILEYSTGPIDQANQVSDSLLDSYDWTLEPDYLSDLTPTAAVNGWGPYERDRSNGENGSADGRTLTLNGTTYAKGLGVHASSSLTYALGGSYSRFQSFIGVDDYALNQGSVIFRVLADGTERFRSGILTGASATQSVDLNVAGVQTLQLIVENADGSTRSDHANWADAKLISSVADTTAPSAALTASGITAGLAGSLYTFTVRYDDLTGVNIASIDNADISVTGPNGYSQRATRVSTSPTTNTTSVIATYSIPAPGGAWDFADNGSYQVRKLPIAVTDIFGNATAAAVLGTFAVNVPAPPPQPSTAYLSDLTPTAAVNGWGPYERDRSNGENGSADGRTLTLNGTTYAKGLGVHASSSLTYALGGSYSRFQSFIGVDDYALNQGSVIFRVLADGTERFRSGILTGASATQSVDLNVAGVQTLQLIVENADGSTRSDHANWADAKLISANSTPFNQPGTLILSGTPTQGQTLTATVADADGLPAAINYQWQQSSNGTTWSSITGATSRTLTLQQAQVGQQVRVLASYVDLRGASEALTSTSRTAAVINVNDPGVVSISGIPTQGQTLTATVADADGLPATINYQWQQSSNGTTWSSITGATSRTLTLQQAQVGQQVRVLASYVDLRGASEALTSTSRTAAVINVNDPGMVSISGIPTQGQTLTATVADADGLPATINYQWQQSSNGTTWSSITGATSRTLTLQQAQVGQQVRVLASYVDLRGASEALTSTSRTAAVINVNDPGMVSISGIPTQGQTLTATVADADGLPATINYQWQQSSNGTTWSSITGATSRTLTLQQAQVGQRVRVLASYVDLRGTSETLFSALTASAVVSVTPPPIGGALNLPLEAWWGGPAYYSNFPTAAAAGWTDPAFFPIAVFYGKPSHATQLRRVGINTYMRAEYDGSSVASMTDAGMFLILQPEWTAAQVGNNPRVVGWHVSEEIDMAAQGESWALATHLAEVQRRRALNDGRFTQANFGNGVLGTWWARNTMDDLIASTDVTTVDKYAYTSPQVRFEYGRSPSWGLSAAAAEASRAYGWQQDRMESIGSQLNGVPTGIQKPNWVFVETAMPFLFGEAGAETIGLEEIEGAVWNSIINGASGVAYFQHNNDGINGTYSLVSGEPARLAKVTSINAQVQRMALVLNSQPYLWNFGTGLDTSLRVHNGNAYILAMTDGGTGTRTFALPPGVSGAQVEVVDEGRSLSVINGTFTDTFPAEHTHRIYRVSLR